MGARSYIYWVAILTGLLSIALLPASFALAQKSAPPPLEEMWRMIKQQQVEIDKLKAQNAQLQEQLDQVPKAMVAAKRLRAMNSHIEVVEIPERLTVDNALALFSQYDVIVDGSENSVEHCLSKDLRILAILVTLRRKTPIQRFY